MKKIFVMLAVTLGMIFMGYHLNSATANTDNRIYIEQEMSTPVINLSNVPDEYSTENMQAETNSQEEPFTSGESTTEESTPEESTAEETTEEETTTPDYIIIDGVYKVKNGRLIKYLGSKKDKSVKKLIIPSLIKTIKPNVFSGCKYIKKVRFAEGSKLTTIGKYTFKNCKALSSVKLPEGLKKIGYKTFGGCTFLKSITIPKTVKYGNTILGMTSGVKTVKFAKGIKIIPDGILKNAYGVSTISLKSGVTSIGSKAFYHCEELEKISMPDSITEINSYAFAECVSLKKLSMPSHIRTIGKKAFEDCCEIESVVLRKSLTYIGDGAFSGNSKLTLQVYANSVGKAYARAEKLNWEYTPSEIKRRAKNKEIYKIFMNLVGPENAKKYQYKYLNNYIPQGVCVLGKHLYVSMYASGFRHHSILAVYNKKSGNFIKHIILPSRDHVGSIANVKGRLVIGLNNLSTTDYVAVIHEKRLKKTKNAKMIHYNYIRKLSGYADFAGYDGTIYWAGHCANTSYPTMHGYQVKVKKKKLVFKKKYTYVVPANTQGIAIKKGKGGARTFWFSTSLGRLPNSKLIQYRVNIKKSNSLGQSLMTKLIPAMAEGLCLIKKKALLVVFESAAKHYCGNPDYTSEIQIKNVCEILINKLSYLK